MYNVLIVGMGGISFFYDKKLSSKFCYTHYRAFKKNKNFKIVGCVEKNITRAKYLQKNTKVNIYKSFKLIPKKIKIDIIVIATPTKDHLISIQNSVKFFKPKIILCEKPLALNMKKAKKIVFLCKQNKIKLFVNFIRISDPGVIKIKKIIKNLKIKKITAWYTKDFIHNGSHIVSLLQFWFGKILKINKISKSYLSNAKDDYVINFKNQTAYVLQGFAEDFEYFSIEMIGRHGRIRYDFGGEKISLNRKIKDVILKNNFILDKKHKIIKNDFIKYQSNVVQQLKNYLDGKKYFLCDDKLGIITNQIICSK